jgi:dTDP-4-dehydrorhamnose 3,5-epimerase
MQIEETMIPDLLVLTPRRFGDARGFFSETWNKARMEEAGLNYDFVQDNHSVSAEIGTLRGLHAQTPPMSQAKLVRCGKGRLLDVAVDARKGSPTFGKSFSVELSFENGKQLLVPEGFLHGFVTREPDTEIVYKCSNFYAPAHDLSIAWDSVGVSWDVDAPILSDKDGNATAFQDWDSPFIYEASS